LVLRPIIMWSRSLSPTQSRWDTWEKELWAVKEFINSWSTIVASCWVVILPDSLNHLSVNGTTPLKNPAKILRWLCEIVSRVLARWCFSPGCVNRIGDFTSRNPAERDELRADDETGLQMAGSLPKTLMDAFRMAHADMLNRDDVLAGVPWSPPRIRLYEGSQILVNQSCLRTPSGRRGVYAIFLPSVGIDSTMNDELPVLVTEEVIVRTRVRVEPLFGTEDEPRRWYEPIADHTVATLKRMKLQIFDSMLHVLRAVYQLGAEAIVTTGEGFAPVWAMLSDALRTEAYDTRLV
jgi:hypothetical protein